MQTPFQAPYDRTTKIVSALTMVLMLGLAVGIQNVSLSGLSVLVVIGAYAFSVRGYSVEDGFLVVNRVAGRVRTPLHQIREARRIHADDLSGCIRLMGSGGLFGYYGLFQTSRLGRCTWYVTDRSRAVLVRTDARTMVLSPGDVDGFLRTVGAPEGSGEARESDAPLRSLVVKRVSLASKVIGAAAFVLGLAGVAIAVMAANYAPGPPEYVLTAKTLSIHDRFYPVTIAADTVEVAAIRVVDFTEDAGWRPALRTGGFANSHYRSGWFRAKNGTKMRLYWANATRVVMLPAKGEGAPVLLEVANPDGFVKEIERDWSAGR